MELNFRCRYPHYYPHYSLVQSESLQNETSIPPQHNSPLSNFIMTGHLKTSDIFDIGYTWIKENHLFKDDYIYISYKEKLRIETNKWGFKDYTNYDVCICGNSIIDIVLATEKYSNCDTSFVRSEIEKKRIWLRDNEPEEYARIVGEDRNIFEIWTEKGYIDPKLLTA